METLAYRPTGAAKALGISRGQLYVLLGRGDIAHRKMGKATLIERAELERYLTSLPIGGTGDQ